MRDPRSTALRGIGLHVRLYRTPFRNITRPSIFQVVDVNILELDPPRLANNCSKYLVRLLPVLPVQSAILLRTAKAARQGLLDVDVLGATVILVVVHFDVNGGGGDGFASEPADALKPEDFVARVAEGLVLRQGLQSQFDLRKYYSNQKIPW